MLALMRGLIQKLGSSKITFLALFFRCIKRLPSRACHARAGSLISILPFPAVALLALLAARI